MLSRSVVGGAPEASETAVGLTGWRSRTCVSSARRKAGIPTCSSWRLDDTTDEL